VRRGHEIRTLIDGRGTSRPRADGVRCERHRCRVKQLKSNGVVFEECDSPMLKTVDSIANRGALKAAWFKDSEENLIGIMQPVQESDCVAAGGAGVRR